MKIREIYATIYGSSYTFDGMKSLSNNEIKLTANPIINIKSPRPSHLFFLLYVVVSVMPPIWVGNVGLFTGLFLYIIIAPNN